MYFTKILLTFRDVNADDTPQDSHVTTATTATASWMKVQVQNFLLGFSHFRGKKKKKTSLLDLKNNEYK